MAALQKRPDRSRLEKNTPKKNSLLTIAAAGMKKKCKKKFSRAFKKRSHKNILNEMVLPIMSDGVILENNRLRSFHFTSERVPCFQRVIRPRLSLITWRNMNQRRWRMASVQRFTIERERGERERERDREREKDSQSSLATISYAVSESKW